MNTKRAAFHLSVIITMITVSGCTTKPTDAFLDNYRQYEVAPPPAATDNKGNVYEANLYNYTLENLVSITEKDNLISYNNLIGIILNQVNIEDIQDQTLKDNYNNLLVALGRLSSEEGRRAFEAEVAPLILQSELENIDGDMMGIFAYHQDPLGLTIGGPSGISFSPGAIVGQLMAWNYLDNCKKSNMAAARLRHVVDEKTKEFNSKSEKENTLMNLRISFFNGRGEYCNRHNIPSGYVYTEQKLLALFTAKSLPQPYCIERLKLLRKEFNEYPPYHIYLGAACANMYLSTRDTKYQKEALTEFANYEKMPVEIYTRDPYRLTLLLNKYVITTGKDSLECLNEITDKYLLYSKDYSLYGLLIEGYLRAKEYRRAENVVASLNILAKELSEPHLNNLLCMAKLELSAEEINATMSQKAQECYKRIYSGESQSWETFVNLRRQVENDENFIKLIAPLFYQFYSFPQNRGDLSHNVRWRDYSQWFHLFHSLCFNIPIIRIPTAGLKDLEDKLDYKPQIILSRTNYSRIYFDSATDAMDKLYNFNKTKTVRLSLGDKSSISNLAVDLQFDPTTNPFTYRVTNIQYGLAKIGFNDAPRISAERYYADESRPFGYIYNKWAYDVITTAIDDETFNDAQGDLARIAFSNVNDRELQRYLSICNEIASFCVDAGIPRNSGTDFISIVQNVDFYEFAKHCITNPLDCIRHATQIKGELAELKKLYKILESRYR